MLRRDPRHRPIPDQKLNDTLHVGPDRFDTHTLGGMVALPVPDHGRFVPRLSAFWDFTTAYPTVRLQAVTFRASGKRLLAAGYRFETPEGAPGHPHAFFHAQPIIAVADFDPPAGSVAPLFEALPVAEPKVSAKDPTFPLDAADYVDLLICLLLALYGRQQGREQAITGFGRKTTDGRLRVMRTLNW